MKYNLPKINAVLIAISLVIVVIGFALIQIYSHFVVSH